MGRAWTQREFTTKQWRSIGMDSDGSAFIAGIAGGRLWTSHDYGQTGTERQPGGAVDLGWTRVCCDSDGSFFVACVGDGRLYSCADSGVTWVEEIPAGDADKNWQALGIDEDGSVVIAGIYGGRLWLSTDSCVNWGEVQPAGASNITWNCACCDSDGSVIVVGANPGTRGGHFCISVNSGVNWAVKDANNTGGGGNWRDVKCSADGSVIIACESGYRVWLSTNTGSTWTEIRPTGVNENKAWDGVSCSADGQILCAIHDSRAYISESQGAAGTWVELQPRGDVGADWTAIDMSDDGARVLLADYPGKLYTSYMADFPATGDVRDGVIYGETGSAQTGTLELPTEAQVENGVGFGELGTEFTGSLVSGGGGAVLGSPIVRGV